MEGVRRKARARLVIADDSEDSAVVDRKTQAFADHDTRLDGKRPPRTDQGIDALWHLSLACGDSLALGRCELGAKYSGWGLDGRYVTQGLVVKFQDVF
jgi:hypothetical protein